MLVRACDDPSSQPEFADVTEEILYDLSKALESGDDDKIVDAILLKIPRICNPLGILRETFIKVGMDARKLNSVDP